EAFASSIQDGGNQEKECGDDQKAPGRMAKPPSKKKCRRDEQEETGQRPHDEWSYLDRSFIRLRADLLLHVELKQAQAKLHPLGEVLEQTFRLAGDPLHLAPRFRQLMIRGRRRMRCGCSLRDDLHVQCGFVK